MVLQYYYQVLLIKQRIIAVKGMGQVENLVDSIEENIGDGDGNETEDEFVVELEDSNFFLCDDTG